MQTVQLTSEELDLLRQVLEHNLAEIDIEVSHADSREFKTMLKRRRETLEHLLSRLPSDPVTA